MKLTDIAIEVGHEKLEVRYVPLEQLRDTFLTGNSKLHDIDKLVTSIKRYGFRDPIAFDPTLNNGDGGIIAGNGRLEALLSMKDKGQDPPRGITKDWQVPVSFGVIAGSEEEAVAFSIDHNWSVTWGGDIDVEAIMTMFEEDKLGEQLKYLELEEFLPLSIEAKPEEEEEKDSFDKDDNGDSTGKPSDVEVRVELGDIWALGNNRLACIDALDKNAVSKFIGVCDRKVDFIWSDPPYGIAIQKKDGCVGGDGAKKYPHILGDENPDCAIAALNQYLEMYPKACQIWWGANHYITPSSPCWIVWDKKEGRDGTEGMDFADAELAWTNQKTAVRIFRHLWMGAWRASEAGVSRIHPTQKPVALFHWCLEKYGKDSKFIFDPFLGSGISIIGAQEAKQDVICYGTELSTHYCTVILERYEKTFQLEPVKIGNIND